MPPLFHADIDTPRCASAAPMIADDYRWRFSLRLMRLVAMLPFHYARATICSAAAAIFYADAAAIRSACR